jgi:dUTP pyrophosphatase
MLNVKKLNGLANLPRKGTSGAAGFDLFSVEDLVIYPGSRALVPLGLSIQVPLGTYGRIAPRSGLAVKHGIQVGAGVIDSDYTGEVKVLLFNHGSDNFQIKTGDRIAQLVIEKIVDDLEIRLVENISETDRGSGGFGSTGV